MGIYCPCLPVNALISPWKSFIVSVRPQMLWVLRINSITELVEKMTCHLSQWCHIKQTFFLMLIYPEEVLLSWVFFSHSHQGAAQ